MSLLLIAELGKTGTYETGVITQSLIARQRLDVVSFRLHLYKHLAPAGSLYIQLQDVNGAKIKDSDVITLASISSANYFHGMVKFDLAFTLETDISYFIELKSSGYTYASNAYVGWVQNVTNLELWGWRDSHSRKGIAR